VLAIYAVAEKDQPSHLHLFELYTDDAATKPIRMEPDSSSTGGDQKMILSRKLIEACRSSSDEVSLRWSATSGAL